jgi:hypothetical protein
MNYLAAHILAALGIAMMVVPHHYDSMNHPMRLGMQLAELVASFGEFIGPRAPLMWLLFLLGYLAPLAPGIIAYWLGAAGAAERPPSAFALLGVALLVLALLCTVVIFVSDLSFGFGGGSHTGRATLFARMIPIEIGLCGLMLLVCSVAPAARQFLQPVPG